MYNALMITCHHIYRLACFERLHINCLRYINDVRLLTACNRKVHMWLWLVHSYSTTEKVILPLLVTVSSLFKHLQELDKVHRLITAYIPQIVS
jgi:hypothetical protein